MVKAIITGIGKHSVLSSLVYCLVAQSHKLMQLFLGCPSDLNFNGQARTRELELRRLYQCSMSNRQATVDKAT